MVKLTFALSTLLAFAPFVSAFDSSSKSNVAVYWGQSSAGSQERLSYYCESDDVDIVILSFMNSFPKISLDFSSACSSTFSDGLLKCDEIASDIATCQSKGKLVLLSMGGASGSYGFSSDSEATTFATTLWNKFLGGSDSERPFGDVVLDGFDLDVENNIQTGYVALGKALRTLYDNDSSKNYYLSAAPQCVYPDASVGDFLSGVDVDFAFIQFYNNYCSLGSNFNWATWNDFAENTSPNKNIKLYMGLAASTTAAGSGYADAETVKKYLAELDTTHLGGISMWDASQAWANTDESGNTYAHQMKELLGAQDSNYYSSTTTSTRTATTTMKSSTSIQSTSTTEVETTTLPSSSPKVQSTTTKETDTTEQGQVTASVTSTVQSEQEAKSSSSSSEEPNTVNESSTTIPFTSSLTPTATTSTSEQEISTVTSATESENSVSSFSEGNEESTTASTTSFAVSPVVTTTTPSINYESSTIPQTGVPEETGSPVPTTLKTVTRSASSNTYDEEEVHITLTTHVQGGSYITSTVYENGDMKIVTRYTGTKAIYTTVTNNDKTVYQTVTKRWWQL